MRKTGTLDERPADAAPQPAASALDRYEAAKLRRATLADAAALAALYRAAHDARDATRCEDEVASETEASMLEWLGRGGGLVLQDASGAFLCALRWRERDGGWQLDTVATRPEARGQGYGRWLMTQLEALAIRANIPTLTLELSEARDDLLAYYGRMGYAAQEADPATGILTLSKRVGGTWQYKR